MNSQDRIRRILAGLSLSLGALFLGPRAVAQFPDGPVPAVVPDGGAIAPSSYWLGVHVRTIALAAEAPAAAPPFWAGGDPRPSFLALEVIALAPDGPARRAGLELGDVIVEAEGRRVRTPDDLRRLIAASGGTLRMAVRDVRSGRFVTIVAALASRGPGRTPAPGGRPVVLAGTLRRGVVAIGGETTGTTLTAGGVAYELDLGPRPDLAALADRLDGRSVIVSGLLEARRGVEVPLRRVVFVTDLRPARVGGEVLPAVPPDPVPGEVGPRPAPLPPDDGLRLTPELRGPRIERDRPDDL